MKKAGILNSEISRVLSYMGHTDLIAIGDCGLPIPDTVERIDLALKFGVPTFMETLETVVADMKVGTPNFSARSIRSTSSGMGRPQSPMAIRSVCPM